MGRKMSVASTCSAAAARAVGPPHGTMFRAPLVRPAMHVSTTGLRPRRWYTGSMAAVTTMYVVEPSPSRETRAVRIMVPTTTLAGS